MNNTRKLLKDAKRIREEQKNEYKLLQKWQKACELIINKIAQSVASNSAAVDFLLEKLDIDEKEYQKFLEERYKEAPQVEIVNGPTEEDNKPTEADNKPTEADQLPNNTGELSNGAVCETPGNTGPEG